MNAPQGVPIQFSAFGQNVDFTIQPPSLNLQVGNLDINRDFTTKLGLDLEGGSRLVFEADTSAVSGEDLDAALESARNIVERRVNFFGVSEPSVQTIQSGDTYRIAVELPGIQDVSSAVELIGATAQLRFREEAATDDAELATAPAMLRLTQETGLTGSDVEKATVVFDPQSGQPTVQLTFSQEGTELFADITQRNVGKPVGIFVDEFPISAPVVQTPITDGNAIISGDFTVETAESLAVAINSGALPVPIELVEQRNIGPTLGQEDVQKSMYAGIVGITMVMLFMIMVYGRLGVIACVSLLIYALISHAVFRLIPVVLTLPGIAGFILSIGMAVDANILIFERIKEELRKDKEFYTAIRIGYKRAVEAIKDANITTLLVMFILFNPLNWEFLPQYGLVRGFALTLAIGVGASLFTSLVITKRLIMIFYKKPKEKNK
jgi:preprotein translocase subunit SecD